MIRYVSWKMLAQMPMHLFSVSNNVFPLSAMAFESSGLHEDLFVHFTESRQLRIVQEAVFLNNLFWSPCVTLTLHKIMFLLFSSYNRKWLCHWLSGSFKTASVLCSLRLTGHQYAAHEKSNVMFYCNHPELLISPWCVFCRKDRTDVSLT